MVEASKVFASFGDWGKKQFSKSAAWMAHKYLAAVRLRKHEKDDMSWFEMQNKMHENYDHPSSIISVSMTLKKSSDFILLFLKNMIISVYSIELFR